MFCKIRKLFFISFFFLIIVGCGQSGPLYLPGTTPPIKVVNCPDNSDTQIDEIRD